MINQKKNCLYQLGKNLLNVIRKQRKILRNSINEKILKLVQEIKRKTNYYYFVGVEKLLKLDKKMRKKTM